MWKMEGKMENQRDGSIRRMQPEIASTGMEERAMS